MSNRRMKGKYRKIVAVLLAFCIYAVMLYFMLFESMHVHHDCTGKDCPICHVLQIAEQLIKQFGTTVGVVAAGFLIQIYCQQTMGSIQSFIQERTLILDKVRIDD